MKKPKLLVVELWGVGDLIIATPFIQAASKSYEVTVLARPSAVELRDRFWPGVHVIPFHGPWTVFRGKYLLWQWPWRGMFRLWRGLIRERFDLGVSARWDPRDHALLFVGRVAQRYGFPRLGSRHALTVPLKRPEPEAHRYEYWRTVAGHLGIHLPTLDRLHLPVSRPTGPIVIHTGAAREVRVWPLERLRVLVKRLRERGHKVVVACDDGQREWWLDAGEQDVRTPQSIGELIELLDQAGLFIGNDSGPGHVAAFCGVPTFTVFGPQLPEWFAPLHPEAEWIEGNPCPYKPCHDYCKFPTPFCMTEVSSEEVLARVEKFRARHYGG